MKVRRENEGREEKWGRDSGIGERKWRQVESRWRKGMNGESKKERERWGDIGREWRRAEGLRE